MIPYNNFLKITLLAGWSDEEIYQQFRNCHLPITMDEIREMRTKLTANAESKKMIDENQKRHLNGEHTFLNKSAIQDFDFQDDVVKLISNLTKITALSEIETSSRRLVGLFQHMSSKPYRGFIEIFQDKSLKTDVENLLLTYNAPDLLQELVKQLGSDGFFFCKGFSNQEFAKYCYFFWNVQKFSQLEFSNYIHDKKQLSFYPQYIDPLRDPEYPAADDEIKLMNRKINKRLFEHLNNVLRDLENGRMPRSDDIDKIKLYAPAIKKMGRSKNILSEMFSYAEHQQGLDLSDDAGVFAPGVFLATPQYNLIRLLMYCGYEIREIKSQLKRHHYNPIPDSYLQLILKMCNSVPGGRKMIEENSKQPSSQQEFYNSGAIRDTFKFPEFYDAVIEDPTEFFSCYEPLNELLSLKNEDYTVGVEILLLLGKDLERINEYLKRESMEELTEEQLKMFQYYFWHIPDFQDMYEKDLGLRLYNYFALDPSNRRYEQHQMVFKTSNELKILYDTGLVNKKEKEEFYFESYDSVLSKLSLALEKKEEDPKMLIEEFKRLFKKVSKYESQHQSQRIPDIKKEIKDIVEGVAKNLLYHGEAKFLDPLGQDDTDPLGEDDIYPPVQDEPYYRDR